MIKIKCGEQKPINYTLQIKSTGLPVNLVNSTIIFQVREDENDTSGFVLEKTITETSSSYDVGQIYDAQNGKFSVFIKSSDTTNLEIGREYFYTIWRQFENYKEVISSSGSKSQKFIVCPA